MSPKYKVTGCARFFVFFIIFIPIVYFGAAFIRGENGMQMLKDFYHKVVGSPGETGSDRDETPADRNETYTIEDLQKEIDKAKAEIRELENEIKEKEKEIEQLKAAGQGN
jgi:predicted RNase H-like nuclease (RuvC/YqgF family)